MSNKLAQMGAGTTPPGSQTPPRIGCEQALVAWRSRPTVALCLILFALLLASDLGFKAWSFQNVPEGGTRLIPSVLSLQKTTNRGAVFGMMQGQKVFFVVASVVAAALIAYFFAKSLARERILHLGLSLILAGAMGNLYDRIRHGAVRDMLHLFPGVKLPFGLRWPGGIDELYPWIFNLADVYLLTGIGIIMTRSFFVDRATNQPTAQDASRNRSC